MQENSNLFSYFLKIILFFYYISYIRQIACHLRKFMLFSIFQQEFSDEAP